MMAFSYRILLRLFMVLGLVTGSVAQADTQPVIKGTASYLERIAVPPDAVLTVALLDGSANGGASESLSVQSFALTTVPYAFELRYDPRLIQAEGTYTIKVSIGSAGVTLFQATEPAPALTGQNDAAIDLTLRKLPRGSSQAMRLEGRWSVFEIAGALVGEDRVPMIDFSESGVIGVKGACNSYTGKAEANGANLQFSENMAGTLMACPPEFETVDAQLLDALQNAARFERRHDLLFFVNESGEPLISMRRSAE